MKETWINHFGSQNWFAGALLHRSPGPALIHADGVACWFIDGLLHCEDGPAIRYPDGTAIWCILGTNLTEKQWKMKIKEMKKVSRQ